MKVDRRFQNGFLVMNSYTFSRSKDLVNENTTIGTPIDFDLSWARSNFDRTHNYVLTTIYELPWGPGKRWMGESTLGKIVGGWQLSGLFIAQSGQPLTIGGNGTLLNTPGNSAFVNLNGSNTVLGGLGPGKLLFRSVRVLASGGRRAGQHEAQQRARRSGLLAARHVALQAILGRRQPLRRVPRRRVQRDELRALGKPQHRIQRRHGQHVRPDHRHERLAAQIRFGGRFVF